MDISGVVVDISKKTKKKDVSVKSYSNQTKKDNGKSKSTERTTTKNVVSVKESETQVLTRKRSRHIQEVQSKLSFFDTDFPADFPIDTEVINNISMNDLYDDYEKSEDRDTPFCDLPQDTQEKFINDMKGLEAVMNKRKLVVSNKSILDDCPIGMSIGHIHESVIIPYCIDHNHKNSNSVLPSTRTKYSKSEKGEYEFDPVSDIENPIHLIENPLIKLDDRKSKAVMRMDSYTCFENYIRPKVFNMLSNNNMMNTTLRGLFKDVFTEIRMDCMLIENKFFGNESLTSKYSHNLKEMLELRRLLIVFRLDEKDIFFLCIVTKPIHSIHEVFLKQSQLIWYPDKIDKKDLDVILDSKLQFESYFYFSCSCENN